MVALASCDAESKAANDYFTYLAANGVRSRLRFDVHGLADRVWQAPALTDGPPGDAVTLLCRELAMAPGG